MLVVEHLYGENIEVTVATHIRKIDRHGVKTGISHGERINSAKGAVALVHPHAVGRPVIIRDIEIGQAVAVEVMKFCGQSPIGIETEG